MSGVDILCAEYKIKVSDAMRHGMNTAFQIVMDSSMIFFSPVVALASYLLSKLLEDKLDNVHAEASPGRWHIGRNYYCFLRVDPNLGVLLR